MKRIEKIGDGMIRAFTLPIRVCIGLYKCVEKNTPERLEMPFEIKRKGTPMEETKKLPVAERVAKKTMGMTKWFTEQYFQTYEMVSKDPRYKTLPPYNQTSCIATIIIATNGALDKIREKDARETAEILQDMSNANEQTGKVA